MTNSEYYAIQNGIVFYREETEHSHHRTRLTFEVPCDKCGDIIIMHRYNPEVEHLCPYCKKNLEEKKKAVIHDAYAQIRSPKEQQFDKAVEKIRGQVYDFDKYERAIELCERRAESFGSIPEAMVAIELVKLGYKVIPQQKIGRYKVDFYLPDENIVIEVDGSLYHVNKTKEAERDFAIERMIKGDVLIIHLPAELVQKKIWKLKDAIVKLQHRGKK